MSRRTVAVHRQKYPKWVHNELRSILHNLLGKSDSRCATAMGVSRLTWQKWSSKPPKNPWMTFSLYHCCRIHFQAMQGRYQSSKHTKRSQIMKRLNTIGEFCEFPIVVIHNYSGAEYHLMRLLAKSSHSWDYIRLHTGGYSPGAMRLAAKELGVIKTVTGYGEDKQSIWELPEEPADGLVIDPELDIRDPDEDE